MGFLRLLESVRVPALDTLFSGITYFGDELAFLALALLLFWCVDKRTGYYVFVVGLFGTLANQFLKITWPDSAPVGAGPGVYDCRGGCAPRRWGIRSHPGTRRTPSEPSAPIALQTKQRWVRWACIALLLLVPVSADVSGRPHAAGRGRRVFDGAGAACGALPGLPVGRKNAEGNAISSCGGIVLAGLFVLYVGGIRADFLPGSEDESNLSHAVKNAWTLLGAIAGLLVVFFHERRTAASRRARRFWGRCSNSRSGLRWSRA